jgi:hypothetical protein
MSKQFREDSELQAAADAMLNELYGDYESSAQNARSQMVVDRQRQRDPKGFFLDQSTELEDAINNFRYKTLNMRHSTAFERRLRRVNEMGEKMLELLEGMERLLK